MKLLGRFNVSKERGGSRKFSFEMSMSGIISVGIVMVLGMCWVFILGILVGRGYRPEAAVPQIAQMMPTTEAKQPDNTAAPAPTVLKPEELQFMDGLQDGTKNGAVVADSTQKTPADGKQSPDVHPIPTGAARVTTAIPAQAPVPVKAAAPASKKKNAEEHRKQPPQEDRRNKSEKKTKAPAEKKTAVRFAATYQVASFPAKEQAQTMAKALSRKGLSASIQEAKSRNHKVFRVKIQIKGTEAEIAEGLRRTGEKGPILLGKKPL